MTKATEQPVRNSLRANFRLDSTKGQAATASAILFLLAPALAMFVSTWLLILVVPAALLSLVGLRAGDGGSQRRLGATGVIMTFDGVMLMVGLFIAGFISDFFSTDHGAADTEAVAFGFTTVHIMLGVGLMLVDHTRHLRQEAQ